MVKSFDWNTIYDHLDKKGIKESSQKQHISQIKRVLRGVFGDKPFSLADIKRSLTKTLEWLQADGNLPNHASRKNHFTSIYQFYEALNIPTRRMKKPFKEITELAFAERSSGLTEKSREKFDKVSFEEIQNKAKEMEQGDDKLLMTLYSGHMPILRGQEWRGLQVFKTKKLPKKLPLNYLHLPAGRLHIGDAKSTGGEGAKDADVPQQITDEIKAYMKHKETDILLDDMSASVMTKRMNKLLGYSIQALRKRYVSERMKEGLTPQQKINLSRIMGHTITTQALDYDKSGHIKNDEE